MIIPVLRSELEVKAAGNPAYAERAKRLGIWTEHHVHFDYPGYLELLDGIPRGGKVPSRPVLIGEVVVAHGPMEIKGPWGIRAELLKRASLQLRLKFPVLASEGLIGRRLAECVTCDSARWDDAGNLLRCMECGCGGAKILGRVERVTSVGAGEELPRAFGCPRERWGGELLDNHRFESLQSVSSTAPRS